MWVEAKCLYSNAGKKSNPFAIFFFCNSRRSQDKAPWLKSGDAGNRLMELLFTPKI